MTSAPPPSDQRGRSLAHQLQNVANIAAVIGALAGVVALFVGDKLTLTITALVAFGIALVAGTGLFFLIKYRTVTLGLWTAVLLCLSVAGIVSLSTWLVVRPDTSNDALPTPPGPTVTTSTPPPPASTTTPATALAGCRQLATHPAIRVADGQSAPAPRLIDVSYTLTPTDKPVLEWAGRVEGRPAAGDVLYLVGTADPSTQDSTPNHYFGTPNYYLLAPITLNSDGCWTAPRRPVGYDCAGGIALFHSMAVLRATDAEELVRRQKSESRLRDDGFTPNEFAKLPVQLLQTFSIDTTPAACPAS